MLPPSKSPDALVAWVTSPESRDRREELVTTAAIEAEQCEMVRFEQELEETKQQQALSASPHRRMELKAVCSGWWDLTMALVARRPRRLLGNCWSQLCWHLRNAKSTRGCVLRVMSPSHGERTTGLCLTRSHQRRDVSSLVQSRVQRLEAQASNSQELTAAMSGSKGQRDEDMRECWLGIQLGPKVLRILQYEHEFEWVEVTWEAKVEEQRESSGQTGMFIRKSGAA
ncbi:hypothetical protein LTS10_006540 [Elasticomyces elasticus]|nr:hypothetical protein LTS10_006540 [Elasticomyces elasticus]